MPIVTLPVVLNGVKLAVEWQRFLMECEAVGADEATVHEWVKDSMRRTGPTMPYLRERLKEYITNDRV